MQVLRPYQKDAVSRAFAEWKEKISTLIVCPTGGGKTTIFCEIARRFLPGRTMVMAHREELIFQARDRMESFGIKTDVEMADLTAVTGLFGQAQCVVATVQTLCKRLSRFDPKDFNLLIIDEFHHATSASYRKVLDYFKQNTDLRVLGVTATPDRADEEALGQVVDSVAFDYEILDAINDGWLVPIEQQRVVVKELDFSAVRTTLGDLNGADLAAVMEQEKHVQGIVGSAIELIGERQAILFAASVLHASKACEVFNRHRAKMATFICGETDKQTRRDELQAFTKGATQVLCNCGVATEGFDAPNVSVILVGRPTESRSLYAQMAGRGLRVLPGIVDLYESAEERRAAIAASAKPACLLVDFVGNSGRHKLMSSADILGGKVSDAIMARVDAIATKAKGAVRMVELIGQAAEQLRLEKEAREARRVADEARRVHLVAKVQYSQRKVNPFDAMDLNPVKERGWDKGKIPSEKQTSFLANNGVNTTDMTATQCSQLIGAILERRKKNLCTWKQAKTLKSYGLPGDLPFGVARNVLDALAANRWRKPDGFDVNSFYEHKEVVT